ncbi:MAG: AraC family transcriptional regulator [Verrucomicrobiota bacterium]
MNRNKLSLLNIYDSYEELIASEYTYKPHGTYGPRVHYDLRLVYPYTGWMDARIDERWHHVDAGQMIFLLPGTEEEYLYANNTESSCSWCAIVNPQPRESICTALAHIPPVHDFSDRFRQLARMAEALYPVTASEEQSVYHDIIRAMFSEFFRIAGYHQQYQPQMHPAVKTGLRCIQQYYHEPLDVPEISRRASVSPQHLVRLFKRDLNTTPTALLWKTRCDHASRLLLDTGFSASEIAYRCGFANPNHFSRAFKAHHDGIPPATYRRNAWRG